MTTMMKAALCVTLVCGCAFEAGERRGSGECPSDETCFSGAPSGLLFFGAAPSGYFGNLRPTAVGGRQTIAFSGFEGGRAFGTGSSFAVDEAGADRVIVRGLSPGADYLRVVHPREGTLIDRTLLEVEEVARIGLTGSFDGFPDVEDERETAFFAGAEGVLTARLLGHGGLLVDEELEIQVDGETADVASQWDSALVTAGDSGPMRVDVVAAGQAASFDVPVVDAVDAVERDYHPGLLQTAPDDPSVVEVGGGLRVCFLALTEGRRVIGAPMSITAEGPIEALEESDAPCRHVRPTETGTITVTAEAPGASPLVTRLTAVVPAASGSSGALLAGPPSHRAMRFGDRF